MQDKHKVELELELQQMEDRIGRNQKRILEMFACMKELVETISSQFKIKVNQDHPVWTEIGKIQRIMREMNESLGNLRAQKARIIEHLKLF